MSITLLATPPVFSSFNDDMVYTVLNATAVADPATYPNYKYIADVLIDGVLVARLKKDPDPVTGIGIFNIGQIARSYSNTVFNPGTGLVSQEFGNAAFFVLVTIDFGESYAFTDYLAITRATTQFFFNSYNNRKQKGSADAIGGKLDAYATNRGLTAANPAKLFLSSNYFFIPFMSIGTTYAVVVTPILANGNPGSPYTTSITVTTQFSIEQFNIAPQVLNTLSPGLINATMQGYTVKVGTTALVYVQLICEPMYTPYALHFLNQYGGFDTCYFTKVSRKNYSFTKTQYGKLPYTVDPSGNVAYKNAAGVYNETNSVYADQYTESMVLNSDLLTDTEYVWLKDLMFTPLIYLEENGNFFSVTITDSSYEAKKSVNDALTNLTLNIAFGNQLNSQFR